MKFDLITENERLWAVRYDDCFDNVLDSILGQWNDVTWLRSFFKQNIDDLSSYFTSIKPFMTPSRIVKDCNV